MNFSPQPSELHTERRLLSFAFSADAGGELFRKLTGQDRAQDPQRRLPLATDGATQQPEQVRKEEAEKIFSDIDAKVDEKQERFSRLPANFRESFYGYIAGFLLHNVGRFDTDRSQAVEARSATGSEEFSKYRTEILQGVDSLLLQFVSGEDRAQMEQERRTREATVKQRTLEQQMDEVGKKMETARAEGLTGTDTFAPETEQDISVRMQEYEQNAKKVNDYGRQLSQLHQEVLALPEKWQEYLKPGGGNAAVVGGLVAAGIGVSFIPAVNIGVWAAGGIALAAYATWRAVIAVSERAAQQEKADEVNAKIHEAKAKFTGAETGLLGMQQTMERTGAQLRRSPETLREQDRKAVLFQEQQLDKQSSDIAAARQKAQEMLLQRTQKQQAREKHQADLRSVDTALLTRRDQTIQMQQKIHEHADDIAKRTGDITDQISTIDAALLQTDLPDDTYAALQERSRQLHGMQEKGDKALTMFNAGLADVTQQARETEESHRETTTDQQQLLHEDALDADQKQNVDAALTVFDQDLRGIALRREDIQKVSGERNQKLDVHAAQVTEGVTRTLLQTSLVVGNAHEYAQLKDPSDPSKDLRVEPQSYGTIVWSHTWESLGVAWHNVWDNDVWKSVGSRVPFVQGLADAVGILGEGLAQVAAHPVDALKGLGGMFGCMHDAQEGWTLFGLNVSKGEWNGKVFTNTYSGLWKFLTAQNEFDAAARGEEGMTQGRAWGKAVGNIALFLLPGAGAVNAGRRAALATYTLSRALGNGGLRAAVHGARAFASVTVPQFASSVARMPATLVRDIVRLPGALVHAGRSVGSLNVVTEAALAARMWRLAGQANLGQAALEAALERQRQGGNVSEGDIVALRDSARQLARSTEEAQASLEAEQATRILRTAREALRQARANNAPDAAQRERDVMIAERMEAAAQARVRALVARGAADSVMQDLQTMQVGGRVLGDIAALHGGTDQLALMPDAALAELCGLNPQSASDVATLAQLRSRLDALHPQTET